MPRKGPRFEIDDAWRARVRQAMAEMNPPMTDAMLAKQISANRSVVSDLFKKKQTHSTYAAEIAAAVGLPPPTKLVLDDEEFALIQVFRALDDLGRRRVMADATARLSRRESNPEAAELDAEISQALDASVKEAEGQTETVQLSSEGSPRSPRTRRAPRSR